MTRKKRTQIRTAAGTAQEAFLERVRALRDDPTLVLPESIGPEPGPLARLRARLERMRARGKAGFLDRRSRGIAGAVAHALPMADLEAAPRLLDSKVGGNRRFFLQRGHVPRPCSLGVQNHDDPRALLQAYKPMAKRHGLHFFAMPRLWCTGKQARPPQEWLDALSERADVTFTLAGDTHGCGHDARARVRLRFAHGPALAICAACGKRAGNLHKLVADRYAGPRQRQPVDVDIVLPGGASVAPNEKDVAAYRGDVIGEETLLDRATAAWRAAGAGSGPRFALGDHEYPGQEAFLDALGPTPYERTALLAMTSAGHVGAEATVAAVLDAHPDRLAEGLAAVLGTDAADGARFAAGRAGLSARELVRQAHEEGRKRQRVADLPTLSALGPVGAWVDATARAVRREDRAAGLERIRRALDRGDIPRAHLVAFLRALGGAMDLEVRFRRDEREAGEALAPLAGALLEAAGARYREALQEYLTRSGSGERA